MTKSEFDLTATEIEEMLESVENASEGEDPFWREQEVRYLRNLLEWHRKHCEAGELTTNE